MFFYRCACSDKMCCLIQKRPTDGITFETDFRRKYNHRKAGIFFYDPSSSQVLVIQSHGRKWGPPKGSVEEDDTCLKACAVREVKEETGIIIDTEDLDKEISLDKTTYFIVPRKIEYDISHLESDVTGIAWIHVQCLVKEFKNETMDLNYHCKRLLEIFFKCDLRRKNDHR